MNRSINYLQDDGHMTASCNQAVRAITYIFLHIYVFWYIRRTFGLLMLSYECCGFCFFLILQWKHFSIFWLFAVFLIQLSFAGWQMQQQNCITKSDSCWRLFSKADKVIFKSLNHCSTFSSFLFFVKNFTIVQLSLPVMWPSGPQESPVNCDGGLKRTLWVIN